MLSERALIIFVKNPLPGTVKTRLAASVGVDKAHEVYLHLLEHTRNVACQFEGSRHLYYASEVTNNDEWSASEFHKHVQSTGDLGTRMQSAFEEVLSTKAKAVIIGSDCPSLELKHIEQALNALEDHDVVIGPSEDGGYYLLGMKQLQPVLFQDKQWSTDRLLEETINSMQSNGLSYLLLDTLNDIDTIEDLERSNLAHLI